MFAVLKREFRSYFQNVIGWLFVAALMALFGLYFYVYNLRQGYPYLYYTLSAITIIFMIAVPILTMRSFAEDRKNKTDQLMLTAPVPVAKVVLGKYLAMLAVFTVDIAVFCVTPLILRAFGTIPMGESYIAILAFWLYGAASIAVGMFISALTESQVIAAVLTFVVLFISYMMQSLTGLISSDGNWLTKILNCLDLYAPQTTLDAEGRRVMISWMRMPMAVTDSTDRPAWNGMMSSARVVEEKEGHLYFHMHPQVDAYLSAETTAEEAAESGKVFRIRTDLSEGETLNIGGYVISRSEGKIVGDRSAVLDGCDEVRTVGATPVIDGAAQLDILVNDHLIEIFVNDGQYVLSHVVYGKSKKISGKYEKVLVGK